MISKLDELTAAFRRGRTVARVVDVSNQFRIRRRTVSNPWLSTIDTICPEIHIGVDGCQAEMSRPIRVPITINASGNIFHEHGSSTRPIRDPQLSAFIKICSIFGRENRLTIRQHRKVTRPRAVWAPITINARLNIFHERGPSAGPIRNPQLETMSCINRRENRLTIRQHRKVTRGRAVWLPTSINARRNIFYERGPSTRPIGDPQLRSISCIFVPENRLTIRQHRKDIPIVTIFHEHGPSNGAIRDPQPFSIGSITGRENRPTIRQHGKVLRVGTIWAPSISASGNIFQKHCASTGPIRGPQLNSMSCIFGPENRLTIRQHHNVTRIRTVWEPIKTNASGNIFHEHGPSMGSIRDPQLTSGQTVVTPKQKFAAKNLTVNLMSI